MAPTIKGSTTAFIVVVVLLLFILILVSSLLIFLLIRSRSRSPRRRHSIPNNTTSSNTITRGWIQTGSLEWDPYDIDRPDSVDPPRTSQSPFRVREPQSTSPVSIAM